MAKARRVEFIMGTAVDIDVRECDQTDRYIDDAMNAAFERLREIERTFTTYDAESVISRIGRGELPVGEAGAEVRWILDLCDTLYASTNGYFDIHAAATRPPACDLQDGAAPGSKPIEPSGVVKGWAIEQAVVVLRDRGLRDYCVNIGGDLYASGVYDSSSGQGWRIGLQHPYESMKVMAVLEISDMAVATSALYARGEHIVNPHTEGGALDASLVSITIAGTDIVLADAYATSAFAMGLPGMEWAAEQPGFEVFAVDSAGMTHFTPGMDAYVVRE